jgi:hypothetical protein
MNLKAMRKGLKYLEEEPKRLDMRLFIARAKEGNILEEEPPCKTVCCFAGAVVLSHLDKLPRNRFSGLFYSNMKFKAMELLQIPMSEANSLFYLEAWPPDFRNKYSQAKTQKDRVAALKSYVKFFVGKNK